MIETQIHFRDNSITGWPDTQKSVGALQSEKKKKVWISSADLGLYQWRHTTDIPRHTQDPRMLPIQCWAESNTERSTAGFRLNYESWQKAMAMWWWLTKAMSPINVTTINARRSRWWQCRCFLISAQREKQCGCKFERQIIWDCKIMYR